ncbi:hypothetical protein COU91_01595 [Candidatus Saccharibacteria bacterium CG10_big_fil_rev_8_21_14_0_10_47_8]|nr:MAG: hypothetical protein COU91_01595 [Candidatus Saccharibacteria bacterium CG10_big_fil_rev_8_21_14_0_10_47_8]
MRRVGFIFLALAFAVQLTAVFYPAQNSLAASPNDILSGITGRSTIVNACNANTNHIKDIFARFGVRCTNIVGAPEVTISAAEANDFWSIGRLQETSQLATGSGNHSINANGTIVWQRKLSSWDSPGQNSTYTAWRGTNIEGKEFWILKSCGNLTFKGSYLYTPPQQQPPKPALAVNKRYISTSSKGLGVNEVYAGDTLTYGIDYGNTVPDSIATNVAVTDQLDNNLEITSLAGIFHDGQLLIIEQRPSMGSAFYSENITVRVKAGTPAGTKICNQAKITSAQGGTSSETGLCVFVHAPPSTPTPPTPPVNPSCDYSKPATTECPHPTPTGYCVASSTVPGGSSRDVTVKTKTYLTNGGKVEAYKYTLDSSPTTIDKTGDLVHEKTFKGLPAGSHTIKVVASMILNDQRADTMVCPVAVKIAEDARVVQSKSVTKDGQDMNGKKVKSGDVMVFKLITKNITNTSYVSYIGQDYFGDTLNYADIVDRDELSRQSITLDDKNNLNWVSDVIGANSQSVKTVTVKVKNVIPTTNRPSNVSADYDCTITNVYGNQISMSVGCPLVKSISTTTTNLPNTGPGTSVMIGGLVAVTAGYLFARSRIMARELAIVRSNYVASGGA